jgi:hypothetical protein
MLNNCIICNKKLREDNKTGYCRNHQNLRPEMKKVILKNSTKYYIKNRETINEKKRKIYKEIKEKDPSKLQELTKIKNLQRKNSKAKWFQENKQKVYKKRNSNKRTIFSNRLRTRVYHALKGINKSGSAVRDLGCSIEELRWWLEFWFEDGMNWDNYGNKGWHIDHIKPLSSFNLTNREELCKVLHYTNLQPLWAKDNLIKSNKI